MQWLSLFKFLQRDIIDGLICGQDGYILKMTSSPSAFILYLPYQCWFVVHRLVRNMHYHTFLCRTGWCLCQWWQRCSEPTTPSQQFAGGSYLTAPVRLDHDSSFAYVTLMSFFLMDCNMGLNLAKVSSFFTTVIAALLVELHKYQHPDEKETLQSRLSQSSLDKYVAASFIFGSLSMFSWPLTPKVVESDIKFVLPAISAVTAEKRIPRSRECAQLKLSDILSSL